MNAFPRFLANFTQLLHISSHIAELTRLSSIVSQPKKVVFVVVVDVVVDVVFVCVVVLIAVVVFVVVVIVGPNLNLKFR